MKGIILAGGTGSRLYPITKVTNKHLLPVGRYPMIYHAVYKLKQCEITDVMIITGKEHMGMLLAFWEVAMNLAYPLRIVCKIKLVESRKR